MPARKPRPKAIDNPGLSHGVVVLLGCQPADATAVATGLQCLHVHPNGFRDDFPCMCGWCCQGNEAAERIAARISWSDPEKADETPKEPAKFKPKRRRARHTLKKPD